VQHMEVRKYRILKFGRFYQIGVCIAERIRREFALRNYTHNFAFVTVHTNAIPETIRISIADLIGGERQHRRLPRAANTTVPAVHKSRRRQPSSPPLVSSSALIIPPICRLTLGARTFTVAAPRAWNSLPSQIHCHFSLSDDSSRHFCSRPNDLTFAINHVNCPCGVLVIVSRVGAQDLGILGRPV